MEKDYSKGARPMPIPDPQDDEVRQPAWGVQNYGENVSHFDINRPKACGDDDVMIDILYCGICHTDVHNALNHLGSTMYPIVPGHEIIGKVREVGSKVEKVAVGDHVGVGCISDSCMDCRACEIGDEQYCLKGKSVHTYNDKKRYTHLGGNQATQTFGGYSANTTLHQRFVVKIPDSLDITKASPILCAGITMYDPLKNWGATKGEKMTIGIIGVGGLGTMGIKLAKALGHEVVAISRSSNKEAMAREKGADRFVVSTDPESMAAAKDSCNLILNTIAVAHDVNPYLSLLSYSGTIV